MVRATRRCCRAIKQHQRCRRKEITHDKKHDKNGQKKHENRQERKQANRKEVPEPGDNLDMILRYCGPWSEVFWKEEHRKTFELTYRVCLENGEISVKPSYPMTVLYAHDPVDFTYTPLYEGFETAVPLLVTRGCFPGRQQNKEKRRILANRRRALRDFETPQDVYGDGTGTNVVKIYIDSDYEEEEDWEEEEDLASKILKN